VETGLGTDGDGIMVLSSDARVGQKAGDYFRIENDWVFEIDITPNRIDSASYLGVAKDVAAFIGLRGEKGYQRPSVETFAVGDHSLEIPVEVLNPEACPRYSGLTISGVEVKESPAWLRQRLKSIGLTPVNNVVDITNFVLFETGQPLHAFDASKIAGGKVIVKTMPSGTMFTTLDGIERILEDSDLMICNTEEGMCIGGVYGGLRSGVSPSTTDIFLESACFDPIFIRKTSRKHGLYTDASFRFERGTDINGTLYALKRAALLITEVAGGVVSSGIRDIYPIPVKGFPVETSWSNIRRLIGKELGKETIKTVLKDIEIKIEKETERGLSLLVPTSKVDVRRECDVIEEILRFYGYNNVEIPDRINATLGYSPWPDPDQLKNIVSEQLVSAGFYEIWSNSLTRASYYDEMSEFAPSATVKLYNPLSRDLNGMRQTLLFGGLECIVLNSNRKNSNLRLFEFGNTYFYHGTRMKENPAGNYHEEEHLALFLSGNREVPNWTTSGNTRLFFPPEKLCRQHPPEAWF
jgi:phenylalanyl-tRNA synthetase beta chain